MGDPETTRAERAAATGAAGIHPLVPVVIVVFAAWLRVHGLAERSLWFDEAFSLDVAQRPMRELIDYILLVDAHPPGFYLLLHGWLWLVPPAEGALRLLSVLAGTATVAVTGLFGARLLGWRIGWTAAAFLAASPLHIMASQELRMYPHLGLWALLSTAAFFAATQSLRMRDWVLYALTTAACLYLHYLGFLVVGAQAVVAVGLAFKRPKVLGAFAAAGALVAVLYSPWWQPLIHALTSGRGHSWFKPPMAAHDMFGQITSLLAYGGHLFDGPGYHTGHTLPFPLVTAMCAPFIALAVLGVRSRAWSRSAAWTVAAMAGLPIIVTSVATAFGTFTYGRHFSFLAPPVALLLAAGAWGVADLVEKHRAWVFALVVIGLHVPAAAVLRAWYTEPLLVPYDWRGAASFVQRTSESNDVIVIFPGELSAPWTYYFRGAVKQLAVWSTDDSPGAASSFATDLLPAFRTSKRILWVVHTVPAPPGSREKLVENLERHYTNALTKAFTSPDSNVGSGVWVEMWRPLPDG